MPRSARKQRQEQSTYLTLLSVFGALVAAFSAYARGHADDVRLGPGDFFLLSLATYRAGELISGDKVMEPVRAPFTENVPAEDAGVKIEPRGGGARRALGELFSCSACTGTWAAAFLLYGLRVAPIPTRVVMTILAATGGGQIIEKAVGAMSMVAQAQQRQAPDGQSDA